MVLGKTAHSDGIDKSRSGGDLVHGKEIVGPVEVARAGRRLPLEIVKVCRSMDEHCCCSVAAVAKVAGDEVLECRDVEVRGGMGT